MVIADGTGEQHAREEEPVELDEMRCREPAIAISREDLMVYRLGSQGRIFRQSVLTAARPEPTVPVAVVPRSELMAIRLGRGILIVRGYLGGLNGCAASGDVLESSLESAA